MAAAARILLRSWALLGLLAALLHCASPAAPEKAVPNRPLRLRFRSSPDRSAVRWRLPQSSGLRSTRRNPGYLSGYGESSRKMSYKPLPKEEQTHDIKKLASESVHVVSLHSRNNQGQSQAVQRAALTKRKVTEEEDLEEAKDITVRVMSSQSVLVSWTDPDFEKQKKGAASRQYSVRYREKGESARWDYKQISHRRVLVDKLIPDTMYEFAVRISQGEKEGKWSTSVYQRTPEAAPTSAPENFDVLPIKGKATSVAASWDALSESEGKVKEYILSYAPALKPFGAKSITYPGDTTSAIVEGLQPGERYIFKIRAANRRGQGPQSKAFSVALPATNIVESKANQHRETEKMEPKTTENIVPSSPAQTDPALMQKLSPSSSSKQTSARSSSFLGGRESKSSFYDLKNKFSSGSGMSKKSTLSSRKDGELKTESHSTEDIDDHSSVNETPTTQPKIQDPRSSVRPHSPVKPSHSVVSSGRTSLRSRTPVRTEETNTDKQKSALSSSSSLSRIPSKASSKHTENERKNLKQDSSDTPSSPEVDDLPVNNGGNDHVDSVKELPITFVDPHLILPSNQHPSGSRKVVPSNSPKLLPSSVPSKSLTSSLSTPSQSHSRHPYKLIPSDTSDTLDNYKSRETENKPAQSKPLSHALRDHRVITSAVSGAATHTLPQSHISSSGKRKSNRGDSDKNDSESNEREDEGNRRGSSSPRISSRPSSGMSVSERFNLFKYRSALTANRFTSKASGIHDTSIQPSKAPSSTQSSKIHPQATSRLASGNSHKSSSSTDKNKRLEDEDESPLPPTFPHSYSPSFSRQSSSVDNSRRSSLIEPRIHHRVASTEKSNPTNTPEESFSKEREEATSKKGSSVSGQSLGRTNQRSSSRVSHPLANGHSSNSRSSSSSTDSLSRSYVEKASLQPSASKYQPDDLESKTTSLKSQHTSPLSKKTLIRSSHALSRQTHHPESSHSQKAITDQSQQKPSLNSRSHLTVTSLQSNENVEDKDSENLEEGYYKEGGDKKEQVSHSESIPAKDISTSRRIPTSLSKGSTSSPSKHSNSQAGKSGERVSAPHETLTSSTGLNLSPGKRTAPKVTTSSEIMTDSYKSPTSSHQSKYVQPGSTSVRDIVQDHQHSRETSLFSKASSTSLRQAHPSVSRYPSGSRVPTRTASQTTKKHGLFQPVPAKVELPSRSSTSRTHLSFSNNDDDYDGYDQSETEENPTSATSSSPSRGSKSINNNVAVEKSKSASSLLPRKADPKAHKPKEEEEEMPISKTSKIVPLDRSSSVTSRLSQLPNKLNTIPKVRLSSPRSSGSTSVSSQLHPTHSVSPTRSSSSPSESPSQRIQNSRLSNPSQRQQTKFAHRQGNGGRPNLTTNPDLNNKIAPGGNGKRNGQKIINGPQGIKWIVDLDRGLVLNVEGRYLQDSQGKPLRVKLGGDGRTIVDSKGAPVVSPDGLPLFGHGRFSKPVANAQDKPIISLGGKPLIGLEMVKKATTPATTTTTTATTTTTTTTTPEPTTTEPPTQKPSATCPPGTYADFDELGNLVLDRNGLPECNSEDTFSGLDADVAGTTESYVIYDEDYEFFETTLPPTTTTTTTATTTTMEAIPDISFPEFSVAGSDPLSEYDAAGKKRFTAPYVTYLNKDPAAPCSLTEALEHFQVDSLDELIPSDIKDTQMRPQKAPHNITIVAVEGCHSFVIVDWAKPVQGDMVTGYLVYSASYDDFIKNKWSTKTAGSTNLPIENLKPNTRYYFKVQAKNPYGYGPVSSSISYVTESDNPLLIVRPPGGEPIWIPFNFRYDPTYSDCSGRQYVKRTWYRKFVGVVLCNSLRYKIYLSDDLRDTFYSIGDSWGRGEDHCQFVDSHLDGRTGPQSYLEALPPIPGYYRQYRQEPVSFGRIGYTTPYYYVGWYECGVPIPGKW